jgi:hypothetical protein
MSRKINRKIWECSPHPFKRHLGNKKVSKEVVRQGKESADNYQFKSCILCQSTGLFSTGRSPRFPRKIASSARLIDFTSHYQGPYSRIEESSSAGESHPHALPEPDVNLSIHPALIVQPSVASPFANGQIDWVLSSQCALTNRPPSVRGA